MSAHVDVNTADGVATVHINRPDKKNALTSEMYAGLAEALHSSDADTDVRAIRILGVPGAFSAGNDLRDFLAFAEQGALGDSLIAFLEAIAGCETPLVAGVDGLAIGVGTTMLLHCDQVVASDASRFQTPFIDLGIVPEAASSLIAPRLMGHQQAFSLLVLGRPMSAADAVSAGFVGEVVTSDQVEARSAEIAVEIASKPAGAVRAARALLKGDRDAVLTRIHQEADVFRERLQSDEAKAAFQAFFARK
ncbi:MAG: crotonase/enoyl-CoA hydratase family protein [Pseudomonadota bacterium]